MLGAGIGAQKNRSSKYLTLIDHGSINPCFVTISLDIKFIGPTIYWVMKLLGIYNIVQNYKN